jgi:hypothetical protein
MEAAVSDALLVSLAALIFVGLPLAAIAWTIVLGRRQQDAPQEPGDQAHYDASLRNVRRINRSKPDA